VYESRQLGEWGFKSFVIPSCLGEARVVRSRGGCVCLQHSGCYAK